MANKTLTFGILALIIMITIIFIGGCTPKNLNKELEKCSSNYTISCYVNTRMKEIKITKENISCSSDDDCSIANIKNFCSPGYPNVLKCAGEKYYCSDDGYCKRCDSCGQKVATEVSGPPNEQK